MLLFANFVVEFLTDSPWCFLWVYSNYHVVKQLLLWSFLNFAGVRIAMQLGLDRMCWIALSCGMAGKHERLQYHGIADIRVLDCRTNKEIRGFHGTTIKTLKYDCGWGWCVEFLFSVYARCSLKSFPALHQSIYTATISKLPEFRDRRSYYLYQATKQPLSCER